jgi:hypothetical protein
MSDAVYLRGEWSGEGDKVKKRVGDCSTYNKSIHKLQKLYLNMQKSQKRKTQTMKHNKYNIYLT